MKKGSRRVMSCFALLIFFSSCIKKDSKEESKESLKKTMEVYLNHQPRVDSSRVKFKVVDVLFFEEKDDYLCEFKVNMKQKTSTGLIDTTGTMSAKISRDYKTVSRKY